MTTEPAKDMNRNPEGRGGFGDHPEHSNPGGRPKNAQSFSYWYGVFKNMSVAELKRWQSENPEDTRTVAADLAYRRIFNSQKDLKEFQEVADRSEGKPKMVAEIEHTGKINIALVEFIGEEDGDNQDSDQDTDPV